MYQDIHISKPCKPDGDSRLVHEGTALADASPHGGPRAAAGGSRSGDPWRKRHAMTNRETLERCRAAVLELQTITTLLAGILPTGRPAGIRTQTFQTSPSTNDPMAATMQLYDGLHRQAEEKAGEVTQLRQQAWRIILEAVPRVKPRDMVILNNYYLLGQTDQEIAQAQSFTREHICRERLRALRALQ